MNIIIIIMKNLYKIAMILTALLLMCPGGVFCLSLDGMKLAIDYFSFKDARFVCYFSCGTRFNDLQFAHRLKQIGIRTSVSRMEGGFQSEIENLLHHRGGGVGVAVGGCDNRQLLRMASKQSMFDAMHFWLVFKPESSNETLTQYIERHFQHLNLSVDADITVVSRADLTDYKLTDVFNFGKIQGNGLEITPLGSWRAHSGLAMFLKGYKYYRRWDFHNLTLRAITVMLEQPNVFHEEMLSDVAFSAGIKHFTKIYSQLLNILKEKHNFRFNYTVAGRWIGSPERNSTLAVTNSLYWREQDISSTGARIFSPWLDWVDICFPNAAYVETKFFYVMPDKGVGNYENRFLTPLSAGVWWCAAGAGAACAAVLAACARAEARPAPAAYALFSVTAAICQQGFDDGVQEKRSSQGGKCAVLVVGVTSMLLYNYYTSSVVSWLLNAAPPSISSLERLRDSSLQLVFEDVGYTRGWLDNPGFYYYSGYSNPIEDELRESKVTKARRTVAPLQTVERGVQLMRTGAYCYHAEPSSASEVIARTFSEQEVCQLGALQMMPPAQLYIMLQRNSPYREFIVWSLVRLWERGHYSATRGRFSAAAAACSGRRPRALALGQAAPAFAMLLICTALALFILLLEILHYRWQQRRRQKPDRQ